MSMTPRDAQGRFIRATPEQKVAAHVAELNAHFDPRRPYPDLENHPNESWHHKAGYEPFYGANDAAEHVFASPPKRQQPIEYDIPSSRLWTNAGWCAVIFVLVVAAWVMTH